VAAPGDGNRLLFTARNWSTQTASWNPSNVLAGVDLSPIPALSGSSTVNGTGCGCLVAPDMLVAAWHFSSRMNVGHEAMFVSPAGRVCVRKIAAVRQVGTSDIKLCRLESDVDGDIAFARVLPVNFADYLPPSRKLAGWYTDQNRRLYAGSVALTTTSYTFRNERLDEDGNVIAGETEPWYAEMVGGDSGAPGWLVIDGEMVLLGTHYIAPPMGPHVAAYVAEINAAMKDMGSPYTLTPVDLSAIEQT
jgi:hypothetical protein